MKTKQIISAALMLLLSVTAFSGCGAKENKMQNNIPEASSVVSFETQENEESTSASLSADISATDKKTHSEYVKTYYVYAEQGAVVTWFDPETGQFSYKPKCETCGQIAGGEHSGGLFVRDGSSYNGGFTCTNSKCSMWAKSQRAIITCSTSGEWIEVDD